MVKPLQHRNLAIVKLNAHVPSLIYITRRQHALNQEWHEVLHTNKVSKFPISELTALDSSDNPSMGGEKIGNHRGRRVGEGIIAIPVHFIGFSKSNQYAQLKQSLIIKD